MMMKRGMLQCSRNADNMTTRSSSIYDAHFIAVFRGVGRYLLVGRALKCERAYEMHTEELEGEASATSSNE